MYRYELHNMRASSAKYGPCHVCGEHVSATHLQFEERHVPATDDDGAFWTCHGCTNLWGHEACLVSNRRQPHVIRPWQNVDQRRHEAAALNSARGTL